jgi:hypothetical protein
METEVARLNDSCVDRTDRNLVQSFSLRSKEGVAVRGAIMRDWTPERMSHCPSAVIEPTSRVWSIDRGKSEEIAGGALEAACGSMDSRD